jgi:hypothetical protein
MTTTNSRDRALKLAAAARSYATQGNPAAAASYRAKAEKICETNGFPTSILDEPVVVSPYAARRPGQPQPERKYPCRFGCGTFIQHTADEMSACAERKRNATGRDSAYDIPANHKTRRHTFDEMFNDFFGGATGYASGAYTRADDADQPGPRTRAGHKERASYTTTPPRAGSERPAGGANTSTGTSRQRSHAFCGHEATKAARAACRKAGGPFNPMS